MVLTVFANIFFPTWMLPAFPTLIWPVLIAGNLAVDSLVLFLWARSRQISDIKAIWKKSILRICLFGFLADLLASAFLYLIVAISDSFGADFNVYWGIGSSLYGGLGCLVAFLLIWFFNCKFTLRKTGLSQGQVKSAALTIAIFTTPYFLLIPTEAWYGWLL